MLVPLHSMSGESVGEIELRDDVFGIEPNVPVMHQALVRQLANARLGTHKAKTRTEVRGGGRKPWRQKGTGRARQGSIRAPQWRGGGVVHGPVPRSYTQKMNRKMRRLALRSALSVKATDDQVIVIDELALEEPKTKEMVAVLERLGVETSVLILMDAASTEAANAELSARNLQYAKTVRPGNLSVRDVLGFDRLLLCREALEKVHELLGTFAPVVEA